MTRTLVPFTSRLPRLWGDFDREMEETMRRVFGGELATEPNLSFAPSLNVAETENGYEVTVDLPGMNAEDIHVDYTSDGLWISGERKSETETKEKTYHRVERSYGSFRRMIRLGSDVDAESIHAAYKEGVLTVTVAKTEIAKPKKIEVHA